MSWKRLKLFQITCDCCKGEGPAAPHRVGAAREATAVGWVALGPPLAQASQFYCPECKEAARERNGGQATRP